jgi:aldehyde:ferredoxin oxidoreductase
MYGNTGKIIRIDLDSGGTSIESLPAEYYRNFIGGSGLAAKYFWENGDFTAEPLSPAAMLIFMNGPLAGLRLSGASRGSVAARSPLTGNWGDSSCGGYFAPALKYAGFDGIVVTGRASSPVWLHIDQKGVTIKTASGLWGKTTSETDRALKLEHGRYCRTLVIGPAGENGVRYANIMNEAHHAFGRAGFGAVMGAKNLKAIAVNAGKPQMCLADPEKYAILRKTLNQQVRESLTGMVLGELGTAAKLEYGVCNGDVPIRNWTSSFWEEMGEALTGDTLSETYLTGRRACAFCSIACKRMVKVDAGPFAVANGPGPEYETIVSFGSLLGSMDLSATCKAGRVCNEMGLDTISTGATLAWATEAMENEALSGLDTEGIRFVWGDMQPYIDILPRIARRDSRLGNLLADGSVVAARKRRWITRPTAKGWRPLCTIPGAVATGWPWHTRSVPAAAVTWRPPCCPWSPAPATTRKSISIWTWSQ